VAITTLAGLLSGLQPVPPVGQRWMVNQMQSTSGVASSEWTRGPVPAAGSYNATLNGVALSSSAAQITGQLRFIDPPSGNTYLARMSGMLGNAGNAYTGMWLLCDRLWHNGGYTITATTAQNSTTPTWPARDRSGSTNGDGVLLALENSATVGAATPTITISYTNSGGTAGRTGTNIAPTISSAFVGGANLISLQAGDTGVRSVQSLTLSASWVSGTINLVAYRPLALLGVNQWSKEVWQDAIQLAMPRMFNGSVPYAMFFPLGATANPGPMMGQIQYAVG
jgi:hypothetical protein